MFGALIVLTAMGGGLLFFFAVLKSIFDSRDAIRRIRFLEKEVAELNKKLFQGPVAGVQKEAPSIAPPAEPKKEPQKPVLGSTPPPKEVPIPKQPVPPPIPPKPKAAALPPAKPLPPPAPAIDWEQFTGVKLFSWIGGFALFLGMVFFVKYSLDHGWISPWVRILATFALGAGCVMGGLRVKKEEYQVTRQTLCAAGVAILYANTFAAHSVYHFMSAIPTFAFMALVTFLSFLLAVRLDSKYIALLGLVGGFLTPPLLSTGVDRPWGLFGYVALLDLGLAAVALRKRWGFLVALSACGTLLMEGGWTDRFFTTSKLWTGLSIFSFFSFFFAGVRGFAWQWKIDNNWISRSAGVVPFLSLFFGWGLLFHPELASRPGVVLGFALMLNALLTGLLLRSDDFRLWHFLGGGVSFLILLSWTRFHMTPELLPWGLAFFLVYCVLHSATPVLLRKFRPEAGPLAYGHVYSVLMLIPFLIPLARDMMPSPALWLVLLLADLAVLFAALTAGALWVGALALIFSLGGAGLWLRTLTDTNHLSGLLTVTLLFGIVFLAVSRLWPRLAPQFQKTPGSRDRNAPDQMTALAALLPFTLLLTALHRLPLQSPSPIFGCGFLFSILLLGIVVFQRVRTLGWITFFGASLPLFAWLSAHTPPAHLKGFIDSAASGPDLLRTSVFISWSIAFFLMFFLLPFLFRKKLHDFQEAWTVSAFSGPVYFYLVYKSCVALKSTALIGLLPAGFAVLFLSALIFLIRVVPRDHALRQYQLALFGGMTLFFVSLIFPLQFEKEWITLGWALEALCLLWLYGRVPHNGLKTWAAGLLLIAFLRLACNPAVFEYHAKTAQPILNWYLYAYGLTALCLIVAAKTWRPPNQEWGGIRFASVGYSLGGILLFFLLNIEIADFFSTGPVLTFRFSGGFAQDMSYTLGWAVFAFVLLLLGIRFRNAAARFTSLALFLVSVSKLFFHDLWRLGQLYRVASFVGLAVTLMLVSYLYQRFLSASKMKEAGDKNP